MDAGQPASSCLGPEGTIPTPGEGRSLPSGSPGRSHPLRFRHASTIVSVTFVVTLLVQGWVGGAYFGRLPTATFGSCAAESSLVGTPAGEYLNLSIFVDPAAGRELFSPANFTVPAHTLIHVAITDHDAGPSNVSSQYLRVCGTVNDTETVNGQEVRLVPQGDVAHTFTVTNGSYRGFSVPVPPATAAGPTTVGFYVYFNATGTFRWQCEANCGETAMSTDGRMSGLVTVA